MTKTTHTRAARIGDVLREETVDGVTYTISVAEAELGHPDSGVIDPSYQSYSRYVLRIMLLVRVPVDEYGYLPARYRCGDRYLLSGKLEAQWGTPQQGEGVRRAVDYWHAEHDSLIPPFDAALAEMRQAQATVRQVLSEHERSVLALARSRSAQCESLRVST